MKENFGIIRHNLLLSEYNKAGELLLYKQVKIYHTKNIQIFTTKKHMGGQQEDPSV